MLKSYIWGDFIQKSIYGMDFKSIYWNIFTVLILFYIYIWFCEKLCKLWVYQFNILRFQLWGLRDVHITPPLYITLSSPGIILLNHCVSLDLLPGVRCWKAAIPFIVCTWFWRYLVPNNSVMLLQLLLLLRLAQVPQIST